MVFQRSKLSFMQVEGIFLTESCTNLKRVKSCSSQPTRRTSWHLLTLKIGRGVRRAEGFSQPSGSRWSARDEFAHNIARRCIRSVRRGSARSAGSAGRCSLIEQKAQKVSIRVISTALIKTFYAFYSIRKGGTEGFSGGRSEMWGVQYGDGNMAM